jgi:hypothetical protein
MGIAPPSDRTWVPPPGRSPCRHCKKRAAAQRKRNLCWYCHAKVHIRWLYGFSTNKGSGGAPGTGGGGGYGVAGGINPQGRLPAEPTDAPPGTPEKVEVMRERVTRLESPFHPDDALMDPEGAAAESLDDWLDFSRHPRQRPRPPR